MNPFDDLDDAVPEGPILQPSPRPGVVERFMTNYEQSRFTNTLGGAAQGQQDQAAERELALKQFDVLEQWETPAEGLVALAGQLAPQLLPWNAPENFVPIGLGAKVTGLIGKPILAGTRARFAAGAIDAAATNIVVDSAIQGIEMGGGDRESFDPVQLGVSTVMGAGIGGGARMLFGPDVEGPTATQKPVAESVEPGLPGGPLSDSRPEAEARPGTPLPQETVLGAAGEATDQPMVATMLGDRLDDQARQVRGLPAREEPETVLAAQLPDPDEPPMQPRNVGLATMEPFSVYRQTEAITKNPDYAAAKGGDIEAAARMVETVIGAEKAEAIRTRVQPGAIFVSPHAEEAAGRNKIPLALADFYATLTGGRVDRDIIQANRVFHTGAGAMSRMTSRPVFEGTVEKGARYVIVDDVTTMGGTLAELAEHIRRGGGEVADVIVLVNASRRRIFAADPADLRIIEERYADIVRKELGIEPASLTGAEARYIAKHRDANSLRKTIAAARQARGARPPGKETPGPEGSGGLGDDDTLAALATGPHRGQLRRDPAGVASPAIDDNPTWQRLKDIGDDLADALDAAAVRLGRITRRNAAGIYKPGTGVIRLRKPDDFDVLVHELGHHLEEAVGKPLKALMRKHDAELVPLAYEGADPRVLLKEGFAEFARLLVTNRAFALKHAPQFDAALRELLGKSHPEILAALDEATVAWRDWLEQPSQQAVGSTIVSAEEPKYFAAARKDLEKFGLAGTIADRLSRAYTQMVDDLNPLFKATEYLQGVYKERTGKDLDLKVIDDPYKLARMSRGAFNAGHMDIVYGVHGYRQTEPSSASLRDALIIAMGAPNVLSGWDDDMARRFGAYLWSRRAIGEWARFRRGDIPNPPDKLPLGDHTTNVAESEAQWPQFKEAAAMVHEFATALWTKKYDAGLITHKQWKLGLEITDYVPGLRVFDQASDPVGKGGRSGSRKEGFTKHFRGSQRDVVNPIESLIADAYETAMAIARNDVIKALDRLALRAGRGSARVAERIPSHEIKGHQVDPLEAVMSAARAAGLDTMDAMMLRDAVEARIGDAQATIFRPAVINEKGEPIVFWRDGGELQALRLADGEFGLQMFSAITMMTRNEQNIWINMLAKPAALLRIGITASPEFIIANFIRDQAMAMIFYGKPLQRFAESSKGMADELFNAEAARRYNAAGGMMGGANVAAIDDMRVRRDLDALKAKGWATSRLTSLKGLISITEVSETGTRLGLFKTFYDEAKARGLDDIEAQMEAAYRARDHLDFDRRGSAMAGVARLVPFLNASLQGLDKTTRQMLAPFFDSAATAADRANAAKAWARLSAVTMASFGLTALMSRHEEYNDLSAETRATHWMIKWGDKWIAVPKPFELGAIINLGEAAWDAISRQDPRWAERYLEGLFAVAMPPNVMEGNPTIASAYELATGVSLRTGDQIVPDQLKGMEAWMQFTATTSELSKSIGKAIDQPPAIIDHVLIAHTGSIGRNALALYDWAASDKPLPGWDDMPILRRFIKDGSRGASSTRAFWDFVGERTGSLEGARRSWQAMMDAGDAVGAADYLAGQDELHRVWIAAGSVPAEARRIHPLLRARLAVEQINSLRREMTQDRIRTADGEISIARAERGAADDILSDLAMVEARNALAMIGTPGYAGRQLIDISTYARELEAAAPALARALADRYATAKVLPIATVTELWPDFRDRLKRDGSSALTDDLAARAKAAGFELDGSRIDRRKRSTVPAL